MKFLVILAASLILTPSLIMADEILRSGTILIFELSVESSYAEDFEREAKEAFDTIQWWIPERGAWRIKTYAVDKDIHPYFIDTEQPREQLIDLALSNTQKTYGDVLKKTHRIEVADVTDAEEVKRELVRNGLNPEFEWVDPGYLFWVPDGAAYRSKTRPKDPKGS